MNKAPKQAAKFLSRKFIITAIILILASILIITDKISGDTFMMLVTANLGVYAASNVATKFANPE